MSVQFPISLIFTAFATLALANPAVAQDAGTLDKKAADQAFKARAYSPYVDRSFPTRPFFGDTHLHTGLSLDAGAFGARLMPNDAYRFARGEQITSSTGQRVKLSRPLDFLVVSDHSDNMGFITDLIAGKHDLLADPTGQRWYEMIQSGQGGAAALEIIGSFAQGKFAEALYYAPGTPGYASTWQEIVKAAEDANDPGRFTAFIGYEWTSLDKGNNLHRNVIFRDNGDKAGSVEPYVTTAPYGSINPRDLWAWMDNYEKVTGGDVLAIAHNGNLSNGIMFPMIEPSTGKPIDREYAEARAKWERLYEVTQIKGDGEGHPLLSPNDEFADYETWDKGNLDMSQAKTPAMFEFEYARSALKNGIKLEKELGVNPYKFGMIGSTDAHTGLSTAEEENFFGKAVSYEPGASRSDHEFQKGPAGIVKSWEMTGSGYAAVWATENTREALFDAMERRETYATTGPRMIVRLFGGWDFNAKDAETRMPADIGYRKGVPMGGDLYNAPSGKSPAFLVAALKDPIGANLDRIQIVKGWLDAKGATQEKVYNVVWGDEEKRRPAADGKLPPVGSTVDVANASWTNSIGDPELITVWTDPDFDPSLKAFYYARVLEIPTPRWTAYDAKRFGITMGKEVPMSGQERAYTSPIWYTPGVALRRTWRGLKGRGN